VDHEGRFHDVAFPKGSCRSLNEILDRAGDLPHNHHRHFTPGIALIPSVSS
jgi:hypothetical protein